MAICSIGGCKKPAFGRGFCKMHHNRFLRHGDPNVTLRPRQIGQCIVAGCGGKKKSHDLCGKHFQKWLKYGDPTIKLHASPGDAKRFIKMAIKFQGDECLIWPFGKSDGYGGYRKGASSSAHNFVCRAVHGRPPKGKREAAHSCGYRSCVNPRHLRWASRTENDEDWRRAKGDST